MLFQKKTFNIQTINKSNFIQFLLINNKNLKTIQKKIIDYFRDNLQIKHFKIVKNYNKLKILKKKINKNLFDIFLKKNYNKKINKQIQN